MSPAENEQTLHRFYQAFARLDAEEMARCYAPEVRFRDEVFTLDGRDQAAGMWAMLCAVTREKGRDVWVLDYGQVACTGDTGTAHWDAHYRFSATGRIVDNHIDAAFRFSPEGKIIEHVDHFDFWAWARQALGPPGALLGWIPFLRNKVRATARGSLERFMAR